jgi:predicted ATP-binding protein involved in virulence
MKLERIHLRNFRCFDELVVEFDPKLTVIIAENGAGKTAILDAIAIGFGRYLTKLPGVSGRTTKDTDIRINTNERREAFMMLAWEALDRQGTPIVWAGGRKRDAAVSASAIKSALTDELLGLLKRGLKQIDDFTLKLVQAEAEGAAYFLPVMAYYGTNRAIRSEVQRRRGFKKQFSRFESLSGALDPDSRFRAAFEWFNAMEDQERREKEARRDFDFRLPDLDLVRNAIVRMLPVGFSSPRTEIRPLRFVINRQMPDGVTRTLRISQLSDGYRVILGLVMDLARRMAQANSRMAINGMQIMNPLDLPAIALIDEVDLHLHPSWQQHVLPDLVRTFPDTQFIVTTHSPQVLSTVKRENIRIIGPDTNGKIIAAPPLAMTYGEPSGDVMHSVMMVDPQPPVIEKADLQRLTAWVDQGNYQSAEAKQIMQSLSTALGEQHPQLQRLKRSIQRQEALKG